MEIFRSGNRHDEHSLGAGVDHSGEAPATLDSAQGTSARKHIRGSRMLLFGRLISVALNLVSIGPSYLPIYEEKKESPSLFGAILLTYISISGIGLPLIGLVSPVIVVLNRSVLDVADTFPELLKIPLVKYLFPRTGERLPASQL